MFKKVTIFAVLSFVLLASGVHSARAMVLNPVPVYEIGCTGISQLNSAAQAEWTRDTSGTNMENLHYLVTDGDGTVLFSYDDPRVIGETASLIGFVYFGVADVNPIRFQLTSPAGNELPEQVLVDITSDCDELPPSEEPEEPEKPAAVPVPGCDTYLPITSKSVVGSFVSTAALYWQPGSLTDPLINIPVGKSAWVLGQDESGEYYQIVWQCKTLWVEKSTMGPNYDSPWNGTPLP